VIGNYTEGQVRTALRRTRSWFRRHPNKWLSTIYYDGRGGYDLVGRFWMELCPGARSESYTRALYGDRVFAVAHDVLRQLVQRLEPETFRFGANRNDLRFGRVTTIQDHGLTDVSELLAFIQDLEAVA
jgi:hypothetical protein